MPTTAETIPALERLYAGVRELLNSESWRQLLAFGRRFRRYSFSNTLLIYFQRPDATLVAGYRQWQELGRQVRRGEKGIAILAPLAQRITDDKTGELLSRTVGFRTVSVFALEQTEGKPLPEQPEPRLLTEDSEAIRQALARAVTFAEGRGIPIERCDLPGRMMGCYNRSQQTIALRPDLPPLQALKTLLHELAHALMHAGATPHKTRERIELEAESCAFVVCDALGLDTSSYSFTYLASWTDDPKELLAAGQQAATTASELLEALAEPSAQGRCSQATA